jgi:hypothetical protein
MVNDVLTKQQSKSLVLESEQEIPQRSFQNPGNDDQPMSVC